MYLASLQDQPPAASRWPDIIFDVRIEILTPKNLLLDMHEGILECDLSICTWLLPASRISLQWPPGGQNNIFDVRIEILALTNIYLDIHEGILKFDLYICIWSASRINLQDQSPAASR